jgi:hypothetical protein
MNPRSVINFFKTPAGAFLAFCVILGAIFFACKRFLPGAMKPQLLVYSTKAAAAAASKQTMQTFQNTNYSRIMNISPPDGMVADTSPGTATDENTGTSIAPGGTAVMPVVLNPSSQPGILRQPDHPLPKPEILPISLFADTSQAEEKPLGKNYAPYGRLIPCELIVTVDSSSIQTPIIGLVTEDTYFGGHLIIPAGTEIHGRAQTDHSRERIASSGGWTFVWQNGKDLQGLPWTAKLIRMVVAGTLRMAAQDCVGKFSKPMIWLKSNCSRPPF